MGQIRVLVVDDSSFVRELITTILSTDKDIKVVGEAANGQEAVEKARELKPDIVTMDIEMPVMNGLDAIELIMASNALPILVVTTSGDAKIAYEAIAKGALDLVVKPEVNLEGAREFTEKVKLLAGVKVLTHIGGSKKIFEFKERKKTMTCPAVSDRPDRIVAIASSTGGPEALCTVLSGLPEKFPCPIVIAQHISDGFVPGLVDWLKRASKMDVRLAGEGPLSAGIVYVSPTEKHMSVTAAKNIVLIERQPKDIYRPSCDVLLSSVAYAYGARAVGVILTGMGSDGVMGMSRIKQAGGTTIAQDEKTSIVFGMPKVAIEKHCVDKILPISTISGELIELICNGHEQGPDNKKRPL